MSDLGMKPIRVYEMVSTKTMLGYFPEAPSKRPWLSRLCFRILNKLQCMEDVTVGITHIPWPPAKNVGDEIMRQINTVVDRTGKPPRLIYVGSDAIEEIRSMKQESGATFNYCGGVDRVLGVEIKFIPWMEGIFAI